MRILTTFLSLAFAVVSFSQSDCGWQPDSDENNFISVTDILAILAVFGQADVDQDGIWDASDVCIDPEACNYNPSAAEDDGSCTYAATGLDCNGDCLNDADNDGICDEDEVAVSSFVQLGYDVVGQNTVALSDQTNVHE